VNVVFPFVNTTICGVGRQLQFTFCLPFLVTNLTT
jgi:hypothetical protein